jgi:hypothetical protein
MFILGIKQLRKHLAIVILRWSNGISADKTSIDIDADAILVAVKSFCRSRSGFSSQPFGSLTALISLFSSRVFRCFATGIRVASMI